MKFKFECFMKFGDWNHGVTDKQINTNDIAFFNTYRQYNYFTEVEATVASLDKAALPYPNSKQIEAFEEKPIIVSK